MSLNKSIFKGFFFSLIGECLVTTVFKLTLKWIGFSIRVYFFVCYLRTSDWMMNRFGL